MEIVITRTELVEIIKQSLCKKFDLSEKDFKYEMIEDSEGEHLKVSKVRVVLND